MRPAALCLLALVTVSAAPLRGAAPLEADRRSAVVAVVEAMGPSVVNISTDRIVRNPFARGPRPDSLFDFFFRDFSEEAPREKFVPNSLGSGVIISSEGYVLTNEHVIEGAQRIRVTTSAGKEYEASVQGVDPSSDLAVLRIEGGARNFPVPPIGRSSDLLIGETVIAIGNPFGLSSTVTTGVLSARRRSVKSGDRVFTDFIQTDASINPGNSGGPLLNIQGELIGINTAIYSEAQGIGFAIPIDRARRIFEDLIRFRTVQPVWTGLVVTDLTPELQARLGITEKAGALIRKVARRSPAEQIGLRPGDVIVKMGEDPVTGVRDYVTSLSAYRPGSTALLSVAREQTRFAYRLTVEPFPMDRVTDLVSDRLGFRVAEITPELQRRYGYRGKGVLLSEVTPGRKAAGIGLETGDVVLELDGTRIEGVESFRTAFARAWDRQNVHLKVPRGGYVYSLTLPME